MIPLLGPSLNSNLISFNTIVSIRSITKTFINFYYYTPFVFIYKLIFSSRSYLMLYLVFDNLNIFNFLKMTDQNFLIVEMDYETI